MIGEALVRVRRGAGVESEHRVAWATTDRGRGGRAHAAGGGSAAYPGPTIYARSAAKPFQALAGVRAGVPERFGLSTEHLAMACASHGGSDAHVERVREVLAAAGRSEDDLECGAAEPRDPAAAIALREAGEQPAADPAQLLRQARLRARVRRRRGLADRRATSTRATRCRTRWRAGWRRRRASGPVR